MLLHTVSQFKTDTTIQNLRKDLQENGENPHLLAGTPYLGGTCKAPKLILHLNVTPRLRGVNGQGYAMRIIGK